MNKFIGENRKTFVCECCGSIFERKSNRQKYCIDCKVIVERRKALERYYNREKTEEFRRSRAEYIKNYRKGILRGYNQSGDNNNHWKNGSGYFQKFLKSKCERCGSTEFLLVHHRDHNHYNNDPMNLETLCKRCHQIEHKCWENFTKGIVRSSENTESEE